MYKKNCFFKPFIVLLGLCLILGACPGTEETDPGETGSKESDTGGEKEQKPSIVTISSVDLTRLVAVPKDLVIMPDELDEQPRYTATASWRSRLDATEGFDEDYGPTFIAGRYYQAVVILTAKEGFTFSGITANSVSHKNGSIIGAVDVSDEGKKLTIRVRFTKTPGSNDKIVTANFASALSSPVKGGTPVSAISNTELTGNVTWQTENGESFTGSFLPSTAYKAIVVLDAKTGYTLSGLSENSFTHPGAKTISFNIGTSTVTIVFLPTAGADDPDPVTLFDLTTLLTAPVYNGTPKTSLDTAQYTGTAAWYYVENGTETAVTGTFTNGKPFKVTVTLTVKGSFSFTGVPANAFLHNGAKSVSNAANSGDITILFDAVPWTPGTITYTSPGSMQACCWNGTSTTATNAPATLLSTNTNNWDYGWNGSANSSSSWASIMKDPLGTGFNGNECGKGHPTIFLQETVPLAIRKRAHVFTWTLGNSALTNIVTFGIKARPDGGQRWAYQFEVFYSTTALGPTFDPSDSGITSLGIFDVPFPGNGDDNNGNWADVNLYERTAEKRGFSARYLHIRVYKAQGTIDPTVDGSDYIDSSFRQFRIGRGSN